MARANRRNWDAYRREQHRLAATRLHAAALYLAGAIREAISEGYPPASRPGEPPHVRSGRLRNSIAYEVDEAALIARVGSDLEYALALEFGTTWMAARPYLRPTLQAEWPTIRRILAGEIT